MFTATPQVRREAGIQVVICQGRSYVQKIRANSDGSYMAGILYTIPTDNVGYILWLKERRQEYAAKFRLLEASVFTLDSSQPRGTEYVKQKLRELDLYRLPSPVPPKRCGRHPLLFTVDLDLQVLSLGAVIHLSLNDLPKDRDKFFAAPFSPSTRWPCLSMAAHHLISFPSPIPVEPECDLGRYVPQYHTILMSPGKWMSTDSGLHWPFYDLAFSKFKEAYSKCTAQEYARWTPSSFMFQELAFAFISFASGRVYFRVEDSTYPRLPITEASWPSELGLGYHLAHHLPGSAPEETIYWFNNILVSLIPEIPQQRHIYIDRTVTFGLQRGKAAFQAILLSLSTVVLLDVEVVDGTVLVKHTYPLELFEDCKRRDVSPPQSPPNDSLGNLHISPPKHLPAPALLSSKESFRALSNFFTTATLRGLKPPGPQTQGLLPNELYYMILDYTDNATFLTCARVSHQFRSYCLSKIRICEKNSSNENDICDTSCPIDTYTHQIIQVGSPMCLKVQNRVSGECLDWNPSKTAPSAWSPKRQNDLYLVPMFGESSRLSESRQAMIMFSQAEAS
ncbi:hypothetical protein AJ78_08004 [Emergomyces pasteurianus Ep9510]|uniref:F-box domain-containing protein n=1 Tax=Emergomyces pasteurianus Ep9510 TaxID=1447872 RepID=A0A1J9Q5G5_9EURO|nr:hypothetical protein AJ78_08004 [Emergomyces pasteurianus Ep9510]